jgi:hypothetical protein
MHVLTGLMSCWAQELHFCPVMQEHIRRYGSVVTTFNVFDDFHRHWASETNKIYRYDRKSTQGGGHQSFTDCFTDCFTSCWGRRA